jgi:hypothetical protein
MVIDEIQNLKEPVHLMDVDKINWVFDWEMFRQNVMQF